MSPIPNNTPRVESNGETGHKGNGGVALPATMSLHDSERAANVKSPMEVFTANGKLSAGANPFMPGTSSNKGKAPPTPIHVLNRLSTADDQPTIVTTPVPTANKNSPESKTAQEPIGTRSGSYSPTREEVTFSTDVGTSFVGCHYVKIGPISKKQVDLFGQVMEDYDWGAKLYGCKASSEGQKVTYFLCFDDLRDAEAAMGELDMAQTGWPFAYINQTEFANAPGGQGSKEQSLYHDGQVVFVATFDGPTKEFNADTAEETVHKLASSFGEMRAFTTVASAAWPNLEFRAEYYRINAAKDIVGSASKDDPLFANNWNVVPQELPNYSVQATSPDMHALENGMDGVKIVGTPHRAGSGDGIAEFASPTGRTAWRTDANGNCVPAPPMKTVPKVGALPLGMPMPECVAPLYRDHRFHSAPMPETPAHLVNGIQPAPRSGSWNGQVYYSHASPQREPIPGPQSVDVAKIRRGHDVRTTVMMRNIPNRMTCHDLKVVLDSVTRGKYDFSYLRIDFEKGTNVGYAFVNFSDPVDIVPFVEGHDGKRWQSNNPRQVELSYATVQGYDCLVEKFRNSAIMEEFKDYRPKLWYTDLTAPTDALIGTEVEFPKPNNWSKRQRSHDNAGQIGLYAPRNGYGYSRGRDHQRRSQFDRGTPAQLREDAYFQVSPVHNGYGFGYPFTHAGYGVNARMPVGPPPPFQMVYGDGYDTHPYMGGYGQNHGFGFYDATDPFAPSFYQGGHANGFTNGFNSGFGTGPGTPASRQRTWTQGKLGAGPKHVTTRGGPVQSPPYGYDNYGSPKGHNGNTMPRVDEQDDDGYCETPGPHFYPRPRN